MVCERPPRSLRSRLPLTRGRAAEGGRGSLTHHLESELSNSSRAAATIFRGSAAEPVTTALIFLHPFRLKHLNRRRRHKHMFFSSGEEQINNRKHEQGQQRC